MMIVKDLLEQEVDIDVCDDYDERCYIAFCGPMKLTEEGEKEFANVLDVPIALWGDTIGLLISDRIKDDEQPVRDLKRFFYSLAGYCSVEDYERWFVDE